MNYLSIINLPPMSYDENYREIPVYLKKIYIQFILNHPIWFKFNDENIEFKPLNHEYFYFDELTKIFVKPIPIFTPDFIPRPKIPLGYLKLLKFKPDIQKKDFYFTIFREKTFPPNTQSSTAFLNLKEIKKINIHNLNIFQKLSNSIFSLNLFIENYKTITIFYSDINEEIKNSNINLNQKFSNPINYYDDNDLLNISPILAFFEYYETSLEPKFLSYSFTLSITP